MGFNDLYEFDFLDSPPKENLEDAIEELTFFDALDRSTGLITETGKKVIVRAEYLYFLESIIMLL